MFRHHYIEVGHSQIHKHSQHICGDVFLSTRLPGEGRVISVLADGLGSGVKAAVLATLTSTMLSKFVSSDIDITRAAEIIMQTLPICSQRKIGYSTFTIIDVHPDGKTSIIEHDNPHFVLVRNGCKVEVEKESIELINPHSSRPMKLSLSQLVLKPEDRIVFYSDGVSQAGMGSKEKPLGQGEETVLETIDFCLSDNQQVSALEMAERITRRSEHLDQDKAKDDITCGVIYFRKPRKTLIVTGPPYDEERDREVALSFKNFDGKKVICGGTTSGIIARELNLEIKVNLQMFRKDIPPESIMEGANLITEGTITLSKVYADLRDDTLKDRKDTDTIRRLGEILLDSDLIEFIVGTKINTAHHDPKLPQELEIRRNLIKNIAQLLEQKYLKKVFLQFV